MSITAKQLFKTVGITQFETIMWGDIKIAAIPNKFGVYVIELNEVQKSPFFDAAAIKSWLSNSGHVIIDNKAATYKSVNAELNAHWHAEETILYVGQTSTSAKGLKKRLVDFYNHKPGNKGPHAGGYWLKLLSNLDTVKVHYAVCDSAYEIEFKMLLKFVMLSANKSDILKIKDLGKYLPFANRTADFDKKHNIKGAIKK